MGLEDLEHPGDDLEPFWVIRERDRMLPSAAVRAQEMNTRLACGHASSSEQSGVSSDVQHLLAGHPDNGPPTFLLKRKYLCWPYMLAPELSV